MSHRNDLLCVRPVAWPTWCQVLTFIDRVLSMLNIIHLVLSVTAVSRIYRLPVSGHMHDLCTIPIGGKQGPLHHHLHSSVRSASPAVALRTRAHLTLSTASRPSWSRASLWNSRQQIEQPSESALMTPWSPRATPCQASSLPSGRSSTRTLSLRRRLGAMVRVRSPRKRKAGLRKARSPNSSIPSLITLCG